MKSVLAVLFSLLLIATQGASALAVETATRCTPTKHCCCANHAHKCCAANPDSEKQFPIAPAPGNPSVHFQLVLIATLVAIPPVNVSAANFSSAQSPLIQANAIPLHQRDCIYLI